MSDVNSPFRCNVAIPGTRDKMWTSSGMVILPATVYKASRHNSRCQQFQWKALLSTFRTRPTLANQYSLFRSWLCLLLLHKVCRSFCPLLCCDSISFPVCGGLESSELGKSGSRANKHDSQTQSAGRNWTKESVSASKEPKITSSLGAGPRVSSHGGKPPRMRGHEAGQQTHWDDKHMTREPWFQWFQLCSTFPTLGLNSPSSDDSKPSLFPRYSLWPKLVGVPSSQVH